MSLTAAIRNRSGLMLVAVVCLSISAVLQILPYRVDDAFIYFRYATQIADGQGLSFNAGLGATEGFTSPLWMAILGAGASVFGAQALPHFTLAMGIIVILLCASVLRREARDAEAPAYTAVSCAALLLCPPMLFYGGSGLESPLFVLVVITFALAVSGRVPLSWGLVAGVCAVWVRPEGAWLSVAWLAQTLASGQFAFWPACRQRSLLAAVVVGALVLVALRWLVMGTLLPNTYYAKEADFSSGLQYLLKSFSQGWLSLLLACAVLGAWRGGPQQRGYLAAGLAWLLAVVVEGGDWMPAGRFVLPACGLLALSCRTLVQPASSNIKTQALAIALLLGTLTSYCYWTTANSRTALATYDGLDKEAHMLATWLGTSQARSIALVDIGRVGYENPDVEILDLGGLTDPVIAHAPGPLLNKNFDPSYVFEKRNPELIVIRIQRAPYENVEGSPVIAEQDAMSGVERLLLRDPRFRRDYLLLFVILPQLPREPIYGKAIFIRRGITLPPEAELPGWLIQL